MQGSKDNISGKLTEDSFSDFKKRFEGKKVNKTFEIFLTNIGTGQIHDMKAVLK